MFDTVSLQCPNCNSIVEEQTKSGPCLLNEYSLENAPMEVMAGILGEVRCYHCLTYFKVEMIQAPKFAVRALTTEEAEVSDQDIDVMGG